METSISTQKRMKNQEKYRRILKALVQFERNHTRILGFPDRKKEKRF